jgi:hypothetical protein
LVHASNRLVQLGIFLCLPLRSDLLTIDRSISDAN